MHFPKCITESKLGKFASAKFGKRSITPTPEPTESNEVAKCCICFEIYNRTNRAPVTMPCGHTFCKSCIRKMVTSIMYQCCVCRVVALLSFGKIGKNVAMIQLLDKLGLLADDDIEDADNDDIKCSPLETADMEAAFGNIETEEFITHSKHYLNIVKEYIVYRVDCKVATPPESYNTAVDNVNTVIESVPKFFADFELTVESRETDFLALAETDSLDDDAYMQSLVTPAPELSARHNQVLYSYMPNVPDPRRSLHNMVNFHGLILGTFPAPGTEAVDNIYVPIRINMHDGGIWSFDSGTPERLPQDFLASLPPGANPATRVITPFQFIQRHAQPLPRVDDFHCYPPNDADYFHRNAYHVRVRRRRAPPSGFRNTLSRFFHHSVHRR